MNVLFIFRHLYKPLLKRGYSKMFASVAVFAMSAFFHEVVKLDALELKGEY